MFPDTRSKLLGWLSWQQAGHSCHEQAWFEFDQQYGPPIRELCLLHLGLNEADVEDILQQVWLGVRNKVDTFQRRSRFRTWVSTLTRNAVRDHFRRQTAQKKLLEKAKELCAARPDRLDLTAEDDDRLDRPSDLKRANAILARIKTQFSERTIKAYYLYAIEGEPLGATAKALGIGKAGVCEAVRRVNKYLLGSGLAEGPDGRSRGSE